MDLTALDRIVLVDDNRADNLYHRLVLDEFAPGVEVLLFESGVGALERLRCLELEPSPVQALILVDLNMPRMTGWEFIDAYFAVGSVGHAQLAVLSTTENPEEIDRAREHPEVSGFLSKPLTEVKLRTLLAGEGFRSPGMSVTASESRPPRPSEPSPDSPHPLWSSGDGGVGRR